MKIAIDAMGGDNAPDAIIKGSLEVIRNNSNINLILVGKSDIINQKLNDFNYNQDQIEVQPASEVITMNDSPAAALKKKKDSSIVIASELVKNNKAEAFISAGNTGAVMAAGLFKIGRLSGIKRPAIATIFPARGGETLVLDAGANVDSKPVNLVQFAIMGQIFARNILHINNPRLGLLSIGEEKEKGNKLVTSTFDLLEDDRRIHNFIGNVEGRDIFRGNCDVVVCDGFVGNVVLKTTEGVANLMFDLLKDVFYKNLITKIGAFILKSHIKKMMGKVDYRQYGGAPLLGIKKPVIISHGSSDATAIVNAVEAARESINSGIAELIAAEINKDGEKDVSQSDHNRIR